MAPPFTFTFDVEDHRPDATAELRLLDATHRVLEFCAERGIVGSVYVVGEVVRDHPGLVREIAAQGHELGLHGWSHAPITELSREDFREQTTRGKDLLGEVAGQEVVGFRAPTFSLVPETVWATEVLVELGFTYSSSILPAWSPLYGFPGLPREPFTWPSGLAELPAPIVKVGPLGLPVVGGTYLRVLPWPVVRFGMRDRPLGPVPFTYCHPYDADPGEPYWVVPGTGRIGSRLLWIGRRRMFSKMDRLMAGGAGPPLRDRLHTATPVGARPIPEPVS
ncbi:MAG TPA: polysaccharide deacetylase family protein [Acidimicrobiales bacterium]|nr:polysaccharide deacetylase family protein [Acidimicrobiales bacterium]